MARKEPCTGTAPYDACHIVLVASRDISTEPAPPCSPLLSGHPGSSAGLSLALGMLGVLLQPKRTQSKQLPMTQLVVTHALPPSLYDGGGKEQKITRRRQVFHSQAE